MITNKSVITLFCSKQLGRETVWVKHTFDDVNFHGANKLNIGGKEITATDEFIIRIPFAQLNKYISPDAWKSLSAEEISDCYTIKKGDYIVKGVAENVSSSAEILKGYTAYEITQVTENFSASPHSKHIKLVVK